MEQNDVQRLLLAAAVHDLAANLRFAKLKSEISDPVARMEALDREPLAPYIAKAVQLLRDTDALINAETPPESPRPG